jgi:hypothetical protein
MGIRWDWFGESVRFCFNLYLLLDNNLCLLLDNNLCLLLDNNLCLLLDNNFCLLLDNNISLRWDYVFYWTLPPVNMFYLMGILGSSTFNFHLVNRILITCESSICVFCIYPYYSFTFDIIPCISLFPTLTEYQP